MHVYCMCITKCVLNCMRWQRINVRARIVCIVFDHFKLHHDTKVFSHFLFFVCPLYFDCYSGAIIFVYFEQMLKEMRQRNPNKTTTISKDKEDKRWNFPTMRKHTLTTVNIQFQSEYISLSHLCMSMRGIFAEVAHHHKHIRYFVYFCTIFQRTIGALLTLLKSHGRRQSVIQKKKMYLKWIAENARHTTSMKTREIPIEILAIKICGSSDVSTPTTKDHCYCLCSEKFPKQWNKYYSPLYLVRFCALYLFIYLDRH